MASAAEASRLSQIRARLAMQDGQRWVLATDSDGMALAADGRDGSSITLAGFLPVATIDEMQLAAGALDDLRFLMGLVDRAIRKLQGERRRAEDHEPRQPRNHSAEAAMLCKEPAFKRYLIEKHGLKSPANDERTKQKLRTLLAVTSRAEINQSDAARDRWLKLRADFNIWKGRALA